MYEANVAKTPVLTTAAEENRLLPLFSVCVCVCSVVVNEYAVPQGVFMTLLAGILDSPG